MSRDDGRKRLFEAFEEISNKHSRNNSTQAGPLEGVVICLTGLASDKKIHIHALVEHLGGRYTRDFNLDKNTHLIAEAKTGAKYNLAASHRKIKIVTPSWLESCEHTGTRVSEASHLVPDASNGGSQSRTKSLSLEAFLTTYLEETKITRNLFEYHQFCFLGFEGHLELKQKLGKLIRRGMGTIHWELTADVTMLILNDNCHEALHKAAQVLGNHHPNLPPAVSPRWVIASWRQNALASTLKHPPRRSKSAGTTKKTSAQSKSSSTRSISMASSVFRGSLFALVRIAPPEWSVDFDSKEQESLIRSHGGQMLTLKLMDAMRTDSRNGGQRRKCYVVCWGGSPQLELNPILSQVKRYDVCDLKIVTPIWLKSCITIQKLLQPERVPMALSPQTWPFQRLESKLHISLTGFQATEKAALVHMMTLCGATFHNEMTKSNSHLICREEASGLKLQKALEWGLHIVSVEWLYHILEHGVGGQIGSKDGCESQFSIINTEVK